MSSAESYLLTRRIFFAALGLIYALAFFSLAVQIRGLVGAQGIVPAPQHLTQISVHLGSERFWYFPSLFWLNSSDSMLLGACVSGTVLSLLLAAGVAPLPLSFALWALYLSFLAVGNVFLEFQWDILLLEAGFLALFLAPLGWRPRAFRDSSPPRLGIFLYRWLLFRLMLESGWVKLSSGDPVWRDLTALKLHYETQPLPTFIGYYFSQAPLGFQKLSCAVMFGIELLVPFLIFAPRKWRRVGAWLLIGFQVLIFLTGNYGFFNLLTIALCLWLWDDGQWPRWIRERWARQPIGGRDAGAWQKGLMVPVAVVLILLSFSSGMRRLLPSVEWPEAITRVEALLEPFHLANSYGLFADMTTERREIRIEGSDDGKEWREYIFKYKPGDPAEAPGFVAPHMPRLDWQMWFQALSPNRDRSWFRLFMVRLLQGSPPVLGLLRSNPFPEDPPIYLRAQIADYRFTDWATKRITGRWWEVGEWREYAPSLSLRSLH